MKTREEFVKDAAERLKKSKSGSLPPKNEKSRSPKPQRNVPKPAKRPTGRGR